MAEAQAAYADSKNLEIQLDEAFDHRGEQWRTLVKGTNYNVQVDANSWQPKVDVYLHKPMLNTGGKVVYDIGAKFPNQNNHPWDRAKNAKLGRLPWPPGPDCECKFCVRRRQTGTPADDIPGPATLPDTFEHVAEPAKPKRKPSKSDGIVETCEECDKQFDGPTPGQRRNQRRFHMKKHAQKGGE